jgi:glutathione S-transferase
LQVRLVIAEKALKCEEHDVSLPLSEHNEPWFMRLNSAGEVPVLVHGENIICEATQIIDYLEQTFLDGNAKAICNFLVYFQCRHPHSLSLFPAFSLSILLCWFSDLKTFSISISTQM